MRKILTLALLLSLSCVPVTHAFSLGGCLGSCSSSTKELTVTPTVQVGFQHLGSNMNLPVNNESLIAGMLQVAEIDLALQDANLWTGSAGVTVKSGELFSVFASAGGSLNRPFGVTGEIPVNVGGLGAQPILTFTASKLGMWYAQGGVSLGPILLGLYGDHFSVAVGDPRRGPIPLNNQTLRGDLITTTLAPYVGFAIPASGGLFTVMYSPLATSNTTLALRTSDQDLAQAQYKWNKPGNFLSCNFQYNMAPIDSVSFGVWANYTWMDVRGNAQLNFQDATLGITRQKDVLATMTKYVIQGGLTAGVTF